MKVDVIIDRIWTPHSNWKGLSYGQLAILFIAFVICERTHVLSRMEKWIADHQLTLGLFMRSKELWRAMWLENRGGFIFFSHYTLILYKGRLFRCQFCC